MMAYVVQNSSIELMLMLALSGQWEVLGIKFSSCTRSPAEKFTLIEGCSVKMTSNHDNNSDGPQEDQEGRCRRVDWNLGMDYSRDLLRYLAWRSSILLNMTKIGHQRAVFTCYTSGTLQVSTPAHVPPE